NRYVDLDSWEKSGEAMFDLRKDSAFRGQGALRRLAEQYLLSTWIRGSAEEVAGAMDQFRENFGKEMIKAIPNDVEDSSTLAQRLADWLYDTSHIRIDYGIEYEGTS